MFSWILFFSNIFFKFAIMNSLICFDSRFEVNKFHDHSECSTNSIYGACESALNLRTTGHGIEIVSRKHYCVNSTWSKHLAVDSEFIISRHYDNGWVILWRCNYANLCNNDINALLFSLITQWSCSRRQTTDVSFNKLHGGNRNLSCNCDEISCGSKKSCDQNVLGFKNGQVAFRHGHLFCFIGNHLGTEEKTFCAYSNRFTDLVRVYLAYSCRDLLSYMVLCRYKDMCNDQNHFQNMLCEIKSLLSTAIRVPSVSSSTVKQYIILNHENNEAYRHCCSNPVFMLYIVILVNL